MELDIPWIIIDKFFKDNPKVLVRHHLDSYNDFFKYGLKRIFKERNPIVLQKEQNKETMEFKLRCELYLGGKSGDKIYYGKPIIYDDDREHYMYPNEARLRNMTYGMTIHYDVEVVFQIRNDDDEVEEHSLVLEKIFLGRFPIMLQSDLCLMSGLSSEVRYNMGECRNDHGGYFIIDGKEKVIVSQEKFADNMLYIRDKVNDIYSHSAEIRSVSEDASKPERTMSVRIVAPSPSQKNGQIVVNVPNVRKPIPFFILMRALGVISDKDIIEYCLLDIEANDSFVDFFIPSIHDASKIFSQENALKYISTFTKGKSVAHVQEILMNFLLPHIGELNFQQKAYFIGYMVYRLLNVYAKIEKPTDRDSFEFKRVEMPGTLLYNLFKEYYALQQNFIRTAIDKEYYYKKGVYEKNFISLIETNFHEYFKERIVEVGFKKAFKGNWGATEHTKRLGAVQDLNRLSFNSFISHLRKINLPIDSSAKIIKPRLLHSSQWGIIDPVDTPDGGNIGLHKHMSIGTHITSRCSGYPLIKLLRKIAKMKLLEECSRKFLYQTTKVFVNGAWVGVVTSPREIERLMKLYRRNGLVPIFTSIHWHIEANEIYIYTDAGRLCRPIFYMDEDTGKPSYDKKIILEKLGGDFTWEQLITGFAKKRDKNYNSNTCKIYGIEELYGVKTFDTLEETKAIIEYIDTAEEETALIAMNPEDKDKPYTHLEIHPSLIFGVLGNLIVFPENNQLPRDLFACGQSKQAVSLYHSNFFARIDKMGVVLNSGQIPLVKSRYLKYINNEEHPYGENVIVAIMSYGGYNVEDSILFNQGSINRGMFGTTYYKMYETREDSSKVAGTTIDSHFANIESENVIGLKPGYDYSDLDKWGLIKENTYLDDKKALIGKTINNLSNPDSALDASVFTKKGQSGYVDKTFMTEGEEGFRLAKVRVRENRVPAIGDKFCSRCGQKGTIGLIIPEKDMPFTGDGIRPDIIINPHALPSRMTIGQLVETIMGKACVMYGGFGDCTAFVNKGPKNTIFGNLLTHVGLSNTGNQLLYNGMNGEQIDAEIFIGPTYYMRLKHMVKDKINYRAQGPRTMLTRQSVHGRANDGGLRIGEMERDAIIAHGATAFLTESMMERGDEFFMAVCNKTGTIAIYNKSLNIFLSPMSDGPIKFSGTLDNNMNIINISKYGRTFSIIRIPYTFKLLMQELQTMNISMRIITSDNVDQLTSMSYSKNIDKLLQKEDVKIEKLINVNRKFMERYNEEEITPIIPTETPPTTETPPNIEGISDELPSMSLATGKPQFDDSPESQHIDPSNLGWSYMGYVPGEDNNELYESIIINENGDPTQKWYTKDHDGMSPDDYPDGWNKSELHYNDGREILNKVIVESLNENRVASNWKKSLEIIKSANIGDDEGKGLEEVLQTVNPITEGDNIINIVENTNDDHPQKEVAFTVKTPTEEESENSLKDITDSIVKTVNDADKKENLETDTPLLKTIDVGDMDGEDGEDEDENGKKDIKIDLK